MDLIISNPSDLEALFSLSEAATKIAPSHIEAFLDKEEGEPDFDLWRFHFRLENAFSQVSPVPWLNILRKSPLSGVPLSFIPKYVYQRPVDWMNKLATDEHWNYVTWGLDRLLDDWEAHAKGEEQPFSEAQVATLVGLAMVLRAKPVSLICILPMLRGRPMYQGEDKLPLMVWMMAQAFQHDLPAALYSWAHNLLPLTIDNKCYSSSQSIDLTLQFIEMILSSDPEARTVLVNDPVRHGERLISPCSFEILVQLTFPASSAGLEATTERFEAIYPLLKEAALAPAPGSANAFKQIFTFSLKFAAQGNPALANEATAIALSVLTRNVYCFKQWDVLYKENLEASVALLKKLVDEWMDHSHRLSSSSRIFLTMISFRTKNEKAIDEGVANCSLYKEADRLCTLISHRISCGYGFCNLTNFTDMVLAAAAAVEKIKLVEETGELSVEDESDDGEEAILSLSKAAGQIDPLSLAAYLHKVMDNDWYIPETQILKLVHYYGIQLSRVSFQWVKMFEEYPISKLIDVPLSLIPIPVYEKSLHFINTIIFDTLPAFVLWASDLILTEWPGVVKVEQVNSNLTKVATFVVLAMVLRTRPDALTLVLPKMREKPTYQGHDKLPLIIWMMAQASKGDLSAGLYSWVRNLMPLVVDNMCAHSIDLILQFVEMILSSNPEVRALLLNGGIRHEEHLIPPCSFEMLVRLTFSTSYVRADATKRFEAIYPLLKEVALDADADALKHIFTFSLELAGQGNPPLHREAIEIAILSMTQNVECFKQWGILYNENLEASVALLKELLHRRVAWRDASPFRSAIISFAEKNNERAKSGGANRALCKEATKLCKQILRLQRKWMFQSESALRQTSELTVAKIERKRHA